MLELFRHSDYVLVVYYRNLLESRGIKTMIRNEVLSSVEASIPVFFPNLCVLEESQYDEALKLFKEFYGQHSQPVDTTLQCCACGEQNPGNFELCFSCGTDLPVPEAD